MIKIALGLEFGLGLGFECKPLFWTERKSHPACAWLSYVIIIIFTYKQLHTFLAR